MSSSKRRKKSIIDDLFGGSIFDKGESLFDEPLTNGYSVSVVQTPEGTKVKAKVAKDTDPAEFRKQLQRKYPNAQIEIEGEREEPLIREISTKSLRKKSDERKTKGSTRGASDANQS
jgi:hypothetical protein